MVLISVVLTSPGQIMIKYAVLNSNKRQELLGLLFNKYLIVTGLFA